MEEISEQVLALLEAQNNGQRIPLLCLTFDVFFPIIGLSDVSRPNGAAEPAKFQFTNEWCYTDGYVP